MKVYLTSDSHFGVHSNDRDWLKTQLDYYYNFFIPNLEKGDKILIHCGDVFDNRELLDVYILNSVYGLFSDLSTIFKEIYIVCGNHDTYTKDSNTINSLFMFKNSSNITVIDNDIYEIKLDNKKLAFLPWSTSLEQEIERLNRIDKADAVFCHTAVNGAVYRGKTYIEHSNDAHNFTERRFKQVYTGHIHTTQRVGNINFIGSPYELTRNDRYNKKSMWYLETSKEKDGRIFDFSIENTYSPRYIKLEYDKIKDLPEDDIKKIVANNRVDVHISSQEQNNRDVDVLMNKLYEMSSKKIEKKTDREEVELDGISIDLNSNANISDISSINLKAIIDQILKEKYGEAVSNKVYKYVEEKYKESKQICDDF